MRGLWPAKWDCWRVWLGKDPLELGKMARPLFLATGVGWFPSSKMFIYSEEKAYLFSHGNSFICVRNGEVASADHNCTSRSTQNIQSAIVEPPRTKSPLKNGLLTWKLDFGAGRSHIFPTMKRGLIPHTEFLKQLCVVERVVKQPVDDSCCPHHHWDASEKSGAAVWRKQRWKVKEGR